MKKATIDEVLWRNARSLADAPGGLAIEGLGVFHGDRFDPRPGPVPTGYDAPRLVVQVADELRISDADVRSHLRDELRQALASAAGRPAPLGTLGLVELQDGRLRFHRSRRSRPAAPGAIEDALAAWRAPADSLGERVDRLTEALGVVDGALAPADQRRLLDEIDYELDEDGWERYRAKLLASFPF